MSEENVELVRYRVVGGPVRVDQRLTLFDSGQVVLDERHRSREPTTMTLTPQELDRIRFFLHRVPDGRWSIGPTLTLRRAETALRYAASLMTMDLGASHFQLKRGRRTIAGEAGDSDLRVVAMLDALRVRAIRSAESLKPTGQ